MMVMVVLALTGRIIAGSTSRLAEMATTVRVRSDLDQRIPQSEPQLLWKGSIVRIEILEERAKARPKMLALAIVVVVIMDACHSASIWGQRPAGQRKRRVDNNACNSAASFCNRAATPGNGCAPLGWYNRGKRPWRFAPCHIVSRFFDRRHPWC